jgi:hypothetical protein
VSTAREIVDALLAILGEERAAIRRVDTTAVTLAAQTKERLAKELGAISLTELAAVSNDLPLLRAELRRNLRDRGAQAGRRAARLAPRSSLGGQSCRRSSRCSRSLATE